MRKIALLYFGKTWTQDVISSTIDAFDNYTKINKKSNVELFPYCINKRGQLRLDRFIAIHRIDTVYIPDMKAFGKRYSIDESERYINQCNVTNVIFYNKEDVKYHRRYRLIYDIISEKRVVKYLYSMDKLYTKHTYEANPKYCNWYNTVEEATYAYISEYEQYLRSRILKLDMYILSETSEIEKLQNKINNLKIESENKGILKERF